VGRVAGGDEVDRFVTQLESAGNDWHRGVAVGDEDAAAGDVGANELEAALEIAPFVDLV
jgi:hypothetical protein